jgi:hypothetical protein
LNFAEHSIVDPARGRTPFCSLTWLCLLLAGSFPASAAAQESVGTSGASPLTVERIEIGIDGHYKVAEWTAVRVKVRTASSQSVALVIEAPDSDGNPATVSGPQREIPAGESQTIESCFRTGRLQGELLIRLVDAAGKTLWQRRLQAAAIAGAEFLPALRHDMPLIVSLAELPELGVGASKPAAQPTLFSASAASATFDPRVIRVAGLGDLPASVRGLESVTAIVIPTARRSDGALPLADLTAPRNALLRDWVRGGGHLVITVASEETSYRESLLAEWVPAKVEGPATIRQIVDLERYSDVNARLQFSGAIRSARIASLPPRNVLVKEGSNPLIAAVPYGFGRVTLIALDIESPPLSSWAALPVVLRKLTGGGMGGTRKESTQSNRQLTQTGITDLATQFQTAQEVFPAVSRPSHWWVMGLLIAYLLVIGPLDYLVVNRWLKRPELTWFTFGALVCLGAAAAVWSAGRINDRGMLCNQLDLIDVDATTRSMRRQSWVSLYSPESRRYAVAVDPATDALGAGGADRAEDRSSALTWSGIPENSVSGVYRSGGAGIGGQPYQFDVDSRAVENMPILQWSTKSLCAASQGETPRDLIEAQLESGGAGLLTGTLTHHLPEPLEDCLFVVGGWAYFPAGEKARIAPDIPWQPGGPQSRARDLKALLTGESRQRKESTDSYRTEVQTTTVPYNPLSENRVDLIQMLSFYQVVGGAEYTGLNHAALRQLELTHLMGLGRGILIGRMKSPVATVKIDGQTQAASEAQTFVRLIVPVVQNERVPAARIPKPGEK